MTHTMFTRSFSLLTVLVCLWSVTTWAFPANGVLDDFNRANENPLANGNWTIGVLSTDVDLQINTNTMALTSDPATRNSAYWSASQFGPDAEAYITGDVMDQSQTASTHYVEVCVRLASPDTAGVDGYCARFSDIGDTIRIFRLDNGTFTQLGADISQAITNSDSVGLSAVGSTLEVWQKAVAGSWTSRGTRTDSTYSAAGYISVGGVGFSGNTPYDNFGGGTIAAAATLRTLATTGVGQ